MTYLLWIAYKGTNYAGFQVQPNALTVCEVLQNAMQAVLGCRPDVKGCSRTDAGVHARRFALSFSYDGKVPAQKMVQAFNAHLPRVRHPDGHPYGRSPVGYLWSAPPAG